MKKILICMLLSLTSAVSFAKSKNDETYKNIMKDLDQIGEKPDNLDLYNPQLDLINKITNLLSWTYSGSTQESIELTPGIFTMLAPRKTKTAEGFEKEAYGSIFQNDSFGSAFLYKDYIVTNFHMCRGLNTLIRDYKNNIYGVKVLKYDIKQDVCILKAPEGVKGQRNFADFKMPINKVAEEIRLLRIDNRIMNIKSKATLSDKDKSTIVSLQKEKLSEERDYGYIAGAYGQFYIYNISEDTATDKWKKNHAYQAYGEKCKGGVSGSPVTSKKGLIGLFWGAEESGSIAERVSHLSKRSPSFDVQKNPTCYFVSVNEIDRMISEYEMESKTKLVK